MQCHLKREGWSGTGCSDERDILQSSVTCNGLHKSIWRNYEGDKLPLAHHQEHCAGVSQLPPCQLQAAAQPVQDMSI